MKTGCRSASAVHQPGGGGARQGRRIRASRRNLAFPFTANKAARSAGPLDGLQEDAADLAHPQAVAGVAKIVPRGVEIDRTQPLFPLGPGKERVGAKPRQRARLDQEFELSFDRIAVSHDSFPTAPHSLDIRSGAALPALAADSPWARHGVELAGPPVRWARRGCTKAAPPQDRWRPGAVGWPMWARGGGSRSAPRRFCPGAVRPNDQCPRLGVDRATGYHAPSPEPGRKTPPARARLLHVETMVKNPQPLARGKSDARHRA